MKASNPQTFSAFSTYVPHNLTSTLSSSTLRKRARSHLLTDYSDTALHYDAVSYVWGTPVFSHTVHSRHRAANLKITPSVDSFLRQLRKTRGPRLLWVDAICLNQKNDGEKSEQIPLMGEIYSQARKVRIWVGEGDENSQKVLKFLHFAVMAKCKNGTLSLRLVQGGLLKIFGSESSEALEAILSNPWFGRRWIIQEAVLGHSGMIHQGSHKVSWELFKAWLLFLMLLAACSYLVWVDILLRSRIPRRKPEHTMSWIVSGTLVETFAQTPRSYLCPLWIYAQPKHK
jgi:Heterokaryon incompatibility protein (HET)